MVSPKKSNPSTMASSRPKKAIQALVAKLKTGNGSDVVRKAVQALNEDPAGAPSMIARAGFITSALEIMQQYPQIMAIQGFACAVMHSLAKGNDSQKRNLQ